MNVNMMTAAKNYNTVHLINNINAYANIMLVPVG